jgi:hypothetical protein
MEHVSGEKDNPILAYLMKVFQHETNLRKNRETAGVIDIILPLGEANVHHGWTIVQFCSAEIQSAMQGELTAMTPFFAAIILEIEAACKQIVSAQLN